MFARKHISVEHGNYYVSGDYEPTPISQHSPILPRSRGLQNHLIVIYDYESHY